MRPFRFAIVASWARSGRAWREFARRAEGNGYDVLLMPDHLGPQFAIVPALAAVAEATTRLRFGSFVFANDYRNPVLLAKEAATLDVLSDGRFELGLGAGWKTSDYGEMGIAYDPPKVRVDRFHEAVRLIKRLFAEERVDFAGEHYRARGARLVPRPVQRPWPPLLLAGGGPRILGIAAREADIVGILPQVDARGHHRPGDVTAGATAAKVARIRQAAGKRFDSLDINLLILDARVGRGIVPRLAGLLEDALGSPYVLSGTPEKVVEDLLERRERFGINYYAIPGGALASFAPAVAALKGR